MNYYLYDSDGEYVGPIEQAQAEKLLVDRKARRMKLGKERHIQLTGLSLSEYRNEFNAKQKVFYRERFNGDKRGSEIVVLKRYDERTGKFRKWHPGLTFEAARAGRFAPHDYEISAAELAASA